MDHADHVNLLRGATIERGGVWADLGSGTGAFTLALAALLEMSTIYSIDQNSAALQTQQRAIEAAYPHCTVFYQTADFTRDLALPPLDGVVMANSLHFHRDKLPIVQHVLRTLKPTGQLVLIEYNVDQGNHWVPYPLSFPTWQALAHRAGFAETKLLATRPSRFLSEFYSARSRLMASPAEVP